ncbi:unnamed protein product [Musa hybrid cultivar]
MEVENKHIIIKHAIDGLPTESDFELRSAPLVLSVAQGSKEVVVKNLFLSIDPYQLNRMKTYSSTQKTATVATRIQPGQRIDAHGVGKVVVSGNEEFERDDVVVGLLAWEEYTVVRPGTTLTKVDPREFPLSYHASILGTSGLTAYAGFYDICKPKQGEKVFVSAASGSVGSLVGQYAKLSGCYVVGCAGSKTKVDLLKEKLGFDDAFNYKEEPDLKSALRRYFPEGIDIYFDNVGSAMLEAAVANMNLFGRVAVCGAISEYADAGKRVALDMVDVIYKRITLRGFLALDHLHVYAGFISSTSDHLRHGRMRAVEDISTGLESAPSAFAGLFRGDNVGKKLVHLTIVHQSSSLIHHPTEARQFITTRSPDYTRDPNTLSLSVSLAQVTDSDSGPSEPKAAGGAPSKAGGWWAMETKQPSPPPPPLLQQLRRRKWVVPLLASFFISSLLISAFVFSSSSPFFAASSLSRQALLLLSFSQIPSPGGDEPHFVESKLRLPPPSGASARPVPRLAYLISGSAGDGGSIRRTLRALYHPANQYVLHLDLEASAAERLELATVIRDDPVYTRFGNVRVVARANLVTYRGPTMVSNTLHAAAILLKEGGDWDWFINLSASDYPLITQDDLLYTLSSLTRDLNFIEHTSDIGWKEYHRARPLIIDPGLYSMHKTDLFWVSEKRSMPTAFKLFTGSAWMMVSHQFIEFCLWGWDNLPRTVLMYYANFLSSPEGYFHTVMCNVPEFRNTTVNHDLHFISWDNPPKQHPHFLTLDDFTRMVDSNAPFARKFGRDDPVLDKIDKALLGRDPDGFVPSAWCDALKTNTSDDPHYTVRTVTELRPGAGAQRLNALITDLLSVDGFDEKHCI